MTDMDTRHIILKKSVELFSIKGYHGTSMRDIASAAECSLPTLYYYFKNKDKLFEEIVVKEFMAIISRLNSQVNFKETPENIYLQVIRQRKELNPHDKAVYKMAMKVWLDFESLDEARNKLAQWEEGRVSDNRRLIDRYVCNEDIREDFAHILVGYMENVMEKIILLDEDIPDDVIKRRLELLFTLVK